MTGLENVSKASWLNLGGSSMNKNILLSTY
uniref:Uncharacterized protein n=1 Tax=Anguilla anguilla TaxID=7936 RepID=A0A0E9V6C6_ANGAN